MTSTQPVKTSRTNCIKRTIVVHFAIGSLLLLFPITYSAFAQAGEPPEEEEQQEDITDFSSLTTSIGPAPTNATASDPTSSSGTGEVDLTSADFSPIRESTATAREAIQNNDSSVAYNALNSADNFLFEANNKIAREGNEGVATETTEQLDTLQTRIDAARSALVNGDNIKTLEEVNYLDIGLFNITRNLENEN